MQFLYPIVLPQSYMYCNVTFQIFLNNVLLFKMKPDMIYSNVRRNFCKTIQVMHDNKFMNCKTNDKLSLLGGSKMHL